MNLFKKFLGDKQPQKSRLTKIACPKLSDNPAVQSGDLDHYVADRLLREHSLDLHSAFQLTYESVRIGRNAYRQSAWGHNLYTRQLYELFMLCLTARALGCADQTAIAEKWFEEDIPFLKKHQEHHFADRVTEGRALLYDLEFLRMLERMRNTKDTLDYDQGPYHFEVFPYDSAPEQELLDPGSRTEFHSDFPLDTEVEAILVELATGI